MSTSSSHNEPRSLLRLDEQTIESVLDKLDVEEMTSESIDRRREKRYAHRVRHCVVKVIQPGSVNPASFAVYLRNLSASGLSFLHGGFLHKGTRCVLQLASGAGKWTEITGQVVNCKYVEQGIHEVGVALSTTIVPSDYCSAANCLTVLLVDDDVVSSRLAMHMLKGMNADVDHVPSGAEALTAVKRTEYGIVMCDLEMPEMDGCATVKQLREEGFKGTILGISASEADEDRARMCEAGCNDFVSKPLTGEVLEHLLADIAVEPLLSALPQDPDFLELLRTFGGQLETIIRELDDAIGKDSAEALAHAARLIKGNAGQYGYPQISDLAREVETKLKSGQIISDIKSHVDELRLLCRRAQIACQSD